jgi:hypothetical protein
MRHPASSPRAQQWQVLSTFVRRHDGPKRLEQAFRLLHEVAGLADGSDPLHRRSDHACSDLRPRLDRPPGTRPDH